MFLEAGVARPQSTGPGVQLPTINLYNGGNGTIYSGIRFDNDGKIYKMSSSGIWQYTADWLLSGAVGDYYLATTLDLGTLTNDDGRGPTVMSTANIDYWIASSVPWFERTTKITAKISDDSAGSNVLVARQYTLTAYSIGTGSPP
jgi:hypothetical protein